MNKDVQKTEQEDPAIKQIIAFVREHDISPAEMFAAYRFALGIGLNESEASETIREEAYALAKIMEDAMDNGLPMSTLVEHVGIRHDIVHAVESYTKLVEELDADFKAKKVLHSIIKDRRQGNLIV